MTNTKIKTARGALFASEQSSPVMSR